MESTSAFIKLEAGILLSQNGKCQKCQSQVEVFQRTSHECKEEISIQVTDGKQFILEFILRR